MLNVLATYETKRMDVEWLAVELAVQQCSSAAVQRGEVGDCVVPSVVEVPASVPLGKESQDKDKVGQVKYPERV